MEIRKRDQQVPGNFNAGAIQEVRAVYPNSSAHAPFSSLFYWAHAWTPGAASTIGEHPHKGFDIISYVIEGSLEHYDSFNQKWIPLPEGSAQIIRSGKGISHAERLHAHTRMFQIWLDPDLSQALTTPASYDDYLPTQMPQTPQGDWLRTHIAGQKGPMLLQTPGTEMYRLTAPAGTHVLTVPPGAQLGVYVLTQTNTTLTEQNTGAEHTLHPNDFIRLGAGEAVELTSAQPQDLFIVQTLLKPNYSTFAERQGLALGA